MKTISDTDSLWNDSRFVVAAARDLEPDPGPFAQVGHLT
jgi:hypothetical protein